MNRSLRVILAVARRELHSYFASPVAYVFTIIFLFLTGVFTFWFGNFFARNEASLSAPGGFFYWHPWLYLFLVPAAGMRQWSEERRSGTVELLLTLPCTPLETIIGKYLAGAGFLASALFFTFPMVITVATLGNPDWGVVACGYLASLLMALAFLAVSSVTSALTRSQVISFILSLVLCFGLICVGWPPVTNFLTTVMPGYAVDFVAAFSVLTHYEAMQRGVLDSRDIVYYFSLIGFSLFATAVVLQTRRSA